METNKAFDLACPDFSKIRFWVSVPNRLSFYSRRKIKEGDVLIWEGLKLQVVAPVSRGSVCIPSAEPYQRIGKYYCEIKFKFL